MAEAKYPSYKHVIVDYGAAMAEIPSQFSLLKNPPSHSATAKCTFKDIWPKLFLFTQSIYFIK